MTRFAALLIALMCWTAPLSAQSGPVTVFAAASLRGPLEEIATQTETQMRLSFGGSGTMARQVAAGAPADVVVLASRDWTDWLAAQGIAGLSEPVLIARNTLVVIAPADTPSLAAAADMPARLGRGRLAMGQRDAVPAGSYARQWLVSVGLWQTLEPRLAETDNVRAALALVARGETPLGVVYTTDARAEPGVRVVLHIPPAAHDPIGYYALGLTPAGAAAIDALTMPAGAAILDRHGFSPVTE